MCPTTEGQERTIEITQLKAITVTEVWDSVGVGGERWRVNLLAASCLESVWPNGYNLVHSLMVVICSTVDPHSDQMHVLLHILDILL